MSTKELTAGSPLPLIFNFTIPLILGNLLQQTYSIIDAAIVSRFLGIDALAGVGASTSVIFLIIGFCTGCCGGFAIPVAQKFGARDFVTMRGLVRVSIKLSAIISFAIAVVTALLCSPILHWMQTPDTIFREAYLYLLITFIGVPLTFFYNLLSNIIRALGDSKTPFVFLVFSTLLNIFLDLLFILVFHWGVSGAAIATISSQGVSAFLCYRYMNRKFTVLHHEETDRYSQRRLARELLLIGTPMGFQFSITAIGCIMLQSANNALGTVCIAAFTAAARIKMIFICMLESLGIAMATYCGQNFGAGRLDRIRKGIGAAFLMMSVFVIVVNGLLWIYSEDMAMLFIDASEPEIIAKTAQFLHVSALFMPFLGTLCIFRYSIQGVGFTQLAMFSGVAEMVARILVSVVAVPLWGFAAVCFGDPIAWVFAVAFLAPAYFYVLGRMKKSVSAK